MYGTIAKIKGKPGAIETISEYENRRQPEGMVGTLVFQSDSDPNELWLVAIFQNKETYFKNANSPEQHQEYLVMRAAMEADPEWHDGEIVHNSLKG